MTDLEKLARQFHDAYERLAPSFGYKTRQETREFDPESPNGKLMMAVCGEVAEGIEASARKQGRIEGLEEAAALYCFECKKGTPFHIVKNGFAFHLDSGGTFPCRALNIRARIKELKGEVSEA